jgi:hypothetical protein
MKKLPIGIQSFEKLRDEDYLYVDKTRLVYELAHSGGSYFFLSRPRRFGKSLLLTTLKAYFEGKRHLFEGLGIMELEHDWKQHPVLHLDLNTGDYTSVEGLWAMFRRHVESWEKQFGLQPNSDSLPLRFADIINSLEDVVILLDEYDKPLVETLDKPELNEHFRERMRSMYSVLKTCDAHIRFAMLTGVSRFKDLGIFSGLNNLEDITLDNSVATLCGFTEDELRDNFGEYISEFAEKEGIGEKALVAKLKQMYDGYCFAVGAEGVYNPFSLLNSLKQKRFSNYWYQSGTTTWLMKQLDITTDSLEQFSDDRVVARSLVDDARIGGNPIALLYETGYLTIKGYDREFDSFRLGFPNREVENSFIDSLLPFFTRKNDAEATLFIQSASLALKGGDPEAFLRHMQSFLAGVPYELVRPDENYYQTVVYLLCRLLGFYTQAEYHTSRGRVDMVLQTPYYIYVFEFKIDLSAEMGARQIEARDYALPFASDPRKLFRVAVSFNTEKRNIDEWQIKTDHQ